MKSNTIKLSDAANTNSKTLTVQKDMNFSGAIENLAKMIPNPSEYTDKIDALLASIQAQAFNIMEYAQEIKEGDLLPHEAYYDYVMQCLGMIKDDLEEAGRLVNEADAKT